MKTTKKVMQRKDAKVLKPRKRYSGYERKLNNKMNTTKNKIKLGRIQNSKFI
jgi:hypothetical protein